MLAGAIRVEADRPRPGVVVHTSPFLLVNMASRSTRRAPAMQRARATRSRTPACRSRVLDSEADVMWSKLVRLNALACTTSAYDELLGEIRSTPVLRADLVGAIEEACAVGRPRAPDIEPRRRSPSSRRRTTRSGSSMQRDIAAGRAPELDAIPGSVLRAGARHGIACPTIERLVGDDRGAARRARRQRRLAGASAARFAVVAQHLQQLGVGAHQVGVVVGRQACVAPRRVLERDRVRRAADRDDAHARR